MAQTKHTHFTGSLACGLPTCSYVADTCSVLCSHLRLHIKDGKTVSCPFNDCHKYSSEVLLCRTHIQETHATATAQFSDQSESIDCSAQLPEENAARTLSDPMKVQCGVVVKTLYCIAWLFFFFIASKNAIAIKPHTAHY